MDLVAPSLEVLLVALLIAALGYCVRLERRLKALREGQAVFAQAVRELDDSVLRAEAGLDQLRKAGEEARDGLHDRILKAREAKGELERLIARAERLNSGAQAQAEALAPRMAPSQSPPASQAQRPAQRVAPAPGADRDEDAAERVAQAILSLGEPDRVREPRRPTPVPDPLREGRRVEAERQPQPQPQPQPQSQPRRTRPVARSLDDDLFEAPSPDIRRAGGRL